MRKDRQGGAYRYHFDHLPELAKYAAEAPRKWSYRSSLAEGRGYEWDLATGYERAVELAKSGWIEGAQRTQRALKAFAPKTPIPATKYDVVGSRPCVARYVQGIPTNMVRRVKIADSGRGRVLTLVVSVAANWYVEAPNMAHYGVAIAQYIRQLEAAHTRVHLIACFTVKLHGRRVTHSWTVKNADQGLDLANVAYSIGHPACFRRLGFALLERCDSPSQANYGASVDSIPADIIGLPANAVILNGMKDVNTNCPTAEAGLAYVEKQIDKLLKEKAQ
jgi:hypothetical protein